MGRPTKQPITLRDNESLRSVMQEVYTNACNQMNDAQKVINELDAATTAEDVDDHTKIAKAKVDALKVKDSAIKLKLDVGKLQSEIIKYDGDLIPVVENNQEIVTQEKFADIRRLIKENAEKNSQE